jgi:hypothetical protein
MKLATWMAVRFTACDRSEEEDASCGGSTGQGKDASQGLVESYCVQESVFSSSGEEC